MNIRIRALSALAGLCFAFVATIGSVQAADRPYTEGAVTVVNSIRTLPGMRETYLRFLATTYRANMDEAKKQGIILGYSVHETTPRSPDDPNLFLMVTYKNMAALDGLDERMEGIQQKSFGDQAARDAAAIDREKMRRQLGSRMIREVVFK